MPLSSIWRKLVSLVVIGHLSFDFAESSYYHENSLDIGTTLDTRTFPPLDGFNKNFLLVADDATAPSSSSSEPQLLSEAYSPNGQDPESSFMQISNTNKDGCRALGTQTDMLPSYSKKIFKRQGKFCPSPFLNLSPGAGTEAGQQQQGTPPADATEDRFAPVGAGFEWGKWRGYGRKEPGKDKKGPSRDDNRKLAPPELNPEKTKCGNFAFDTYLVCGPLIGASPSLLDSISVLLAGANPWIPPGCKDPDMTWCCRIVEKRIIQFNPVLDFSFAGYAYQADLCQPQSIFGASSAG